MQIPFIHRYAMTSDAPIRQTLTSGSRAPVSFGQLPNGVAGAHDRAPNPRHNPTSMLQFRRGKTSKPARHARGPEGPQTMPRILGPGFVVVWLSLARVWVRIPGRCADRHADRLPDRQET